MDLAHCIDGGLHSVLLLSGGLLLLALFLGLAQLLYQFQGFDRNARFCSEV